ncbi:unnamed protein product [Dibothriocephalus latus]|uniref:Galactosyltransferase N-terminal domain-containing protein n=1 Tax=Dibothriocephalus latus TaxID=60516 RepID=A0A3P7LGR5_DIBLA|nr:unnamed protein product [Dibothriocephalus latus]
MPILSLRGLPNPQHLLSIIPRSQYQSEIGAVNAKLSEEIFMPEFDYTKEKVAIIVPYRNRSQQLYAFLHHMWPFLSKQRKQYVLIVTEQAGTTAFNRAKLFNVAVRAVKESSNDDDQLYDINCFILHDVDKVPISPSVVYECGQNFCHDICVTTRPYCIFRMYGAFMGAATAFRWEHIKTINGASNLFYGWGGENDDLRIRLKANKIPVDQPPAREGMFYEFEREHPASVENRREDIGLMDPQNATHRWKTDGINQTRYTLLKRIDYNFFIWLLVSI